MHYHIEDEYERDYSFEPEIILRRKDSLSIQREHYQHRKQLKRRKQFKQSQIVAIARLPVIRRLSSSPAEGGPMAQCSGTADAGGSFQQPTPASPTDQSDDLDSDDKAEIQRSPVEVELEEFYYVSPFVLMASPRGLSLSFAGVLIAFSGFSFFSFNSGEPKLEITDPTVDSPAMTEMYTTSDTTSTKSASLPLFSESFYCLFIQSLPNSKIFNHCVKVIGEKCYFMTLFK